MTDFILASGSQIRRQVLENAGIPFSVDKPDVDESVIKAQRSELDPADMALVLGRSRASFGWSSALVLRTGLLARPQPD